MRDISDSNLKGFPKTYDWGDVDPDHAKYFAPNTSAKFIVQNRLGKTLSDIFMESRRRLRQVDVLKIGILLLKAIQRLHSIGYLHLDIKPDNMLLEPNKEDNANSYIRSRQELKSFEQVEHACRQIRAIQSNVNANEQKWVTCDLFMIDFGVSRKYYDEATKKHLPNKEVHSFVGNIIFASHHAFKCQTLSRRDDIIQIVYNMVYLMNPDNSWIFEILSSSNIHEEMRLFKNRATPEDICKGERT
jgi:casein kinase 1